MSCLVINFFFFSFFFKLLLMLYLSMLYIFIFFFLYLMVNKVDYNVVVPFCMSFILSLVLSVSRVTEKLVHGFS